MLVSVGYNPSITRLTVNLLKAKELRYVYKHCQASLNLANRYCRPNNESPSNARPCCRSDLTDVESSKWWKRSVIEMLLHDR